MENSTSFVFVLTTEKEKGSVVYLNSISRAWVGLEDGRGTTESGTS